MKTKKSKKRIRQSKPAPKAGDFFALSREDVSKMAVRCTDAAIVAALEYASEIGLKGLANLPVTDLIRAIEFALHNEWKAFNFGLRSRRT